MRDISRVVNALFHTEGKCHCKTEEQCRKAIVLFLNMYISESKGA